MTKEGINNLYLNEFTEHLKVTEKSERTIETYLYNLNRFIIYFEQMELDTFCPSIVSKIDLLDYRSFCQTRGFKTSTINLMMASLIVYFNFIFEGGYIDENPAIKIKKLKSNSMARYNDKAFAEKEFRAIRRSVYRSKKTQHILIFELLSKTGIRATSLINLKINSNNMNFGVTNSRTGSIEILAKGNSTYEVPLHKDLRTALRNWIEERKKKNIISD